MASHTEDVELIERAITLAQEAQRSGSGAPIGCIIVVDGEIVACGENEVEATNDPTAHAEIVAIRQVSRKLKSSRFEGATMYFYPAALRHVYHGGDLGRHFTDCLRRGTRPGA